MRARAHIISRKSEIRFLFARGRKDNRPRGDFVDFTWPSIVSP